MSLEKFLGNFLPALGTYALMRNYESLPLSTNGSDIDILMMPGQETNCLYALKKALTAVSANILTEYTQPGFHKVIVIGPDLNKTEGWWGVCIDLFFGCKFAGTAEFLDEALVLEYVEIHNGMNVLEADLADLLGVWKHILHHDNLPTDYLPGALQALQKNPNMQDENSF